MWYKQSDYLQKFQTIPDQENLAHLIKKRTLGNENLYIKTTKNLLDYLQNLPCVRESRVCGVGKGEV